MRIKRNGTEYTVIAHSTETNEVCVEDWFDVHDNGVMRKLKLWWSLNDCEIVEPPCKGTQCTYIIPDDISGYAQLSKFKTTNPKRCNYSTKVK